MPVVHAPLLLSPAHGKPPGARNLPAPCADDQFDLVFSADVLEHIMPGEADAVVSELVRVAKRHVVMSISLKSYQNAGLHTLLRSRQWWEAIFIMHGAQPNRALVWALQEKDNRWAGPGRVGRQLPCLKAQLGSKAAYVACSCRKMRLTCPLLLLAMV
jgi:hypothetical protein